ncbi:Hypothetical protein R9X50_00643000 [Acrodontium crateriforme]|uniref:NAD(P)-binding protein n=1 Tax=Acrodontium crateriforme TaxID=150365 RepID=A0AAQ3M945_9PEZI|nr:Hypothetical protein R9X50_00643000 [Acrodontium crateriforme]
MSGPTPAAVSALLRSQLCFHPPLPTSSFKDQTVIITGGNTGLGREAAMHIVRLGAAKVIISVRSLVKGEVAKEYIEKETGRKDVVEVWELDLSTSESVRAFAKRVSEDLVRLDAVIENAGMWPKTFELVESHEATIKTNVLSTLLLANLLIPTLLKSAKANPSTTPVLTFVDSALHKFATLKARRTSSNIITALSTSPGVTKAFDGDMRYNDSKLLLLLYAQKLSESIPLSPETNKPLVCINAVNPGYCISGLVVASGFAARTAEKVMARSTDEGARTLVDAVAADKVRTEERWGAYIDDMRVQKPAAWIETKEGQETKERVWRDVNEILGL